MLALTGTQKGKYSGYAHLMRTGLVKMTKLGYSRWQGKKMALFYILRFNKKTPHRIPDLCRMALLPFHQAELLEAGCDEAGRGCLAGPVFAAAVILPKGFHHPLLNDSKQLSENHRDVLREIIEKESLAWAVAEVSAEEIDRINILQSSLLAMHRALDALITRPQFILVDGNKFHPYPATPHLCVVKGDGKYASIAAASILAKTHRDETMTRLHTEYPQYHWLQNKGYPTALHREAIRQHCISPWHRLSFGLLPAAEQLALF